MGKILVSGDPGPVTRPIPDYQLFPGWTVLITVKPMGNSVDQLFSEDSELGSGKIPYTLDYNGEINLPLIDKVSLNGIRFSEAEAILRGQLNTYLKNTYIQVELPPFQIETFGSIKNPGVYFAEKKFPTVFTAVALSGGLENYADPTSVKIIRHMSDTVLTNNVDLTRSNSIPNDWYYLRHGDQVYFSPELTSTGK